MIDKQALKILFNNRTQKKDYQLSSLDNQRQSFFFLPNFYLFYIYINIEPLAKIFIIQPLVIRIPSKGQTYPTLKSRINLPFWFSPRMMKFPHFFRQCFDYDFHRYTLIVLQAPDFRLRAISCTYAIPPSSYLTRLRRAIPPVCLFNQCTQFLGLGICGHDTNLSHSRAQWIKHAPIATEHIF